MTKTIGVDIGAQKTMLVADDADIVLTDTGGISRPTLVAFLDSSRLVGEQALPQISSDSTVSLLNLLIGQKEIRNLNVKSHSRVNISNTSSGLSVDVNYCDKRETFSVTSVLAMFIHKLYQRSVAIYGSDIQLSFALPPNFNSSIPRAIKEACAIVDINESLLSFVDASDCIVATYQRKLLALRGSEINALDDKKVVLVEIGHSQTTIVVVHVKLVDNVLIPTKLSTAHDDNLGCVDFDFKLFSYFASICKKQNPSSEEIAAGSKRGQRLLLSCERARKLLSQLNEAKITVENLTDSGDVNFTIRREDYSQITGDLIERFKALIESALEKSVASFDKSISAIEIIGGGCRMPVIQNVLFALFGEGIPLGAKFDDASVALGAALCKNKENNEGIVFSTSNINFAESIGLTAGEIESATSREKEMQRNDAELEMKLAARNKLESFILEMRSAKRRKHGEKIDSVKLEKLLDESESWLWDNVDADLASLQSKDKLIRDQVNEICKEFFELTERDRVAVEKALEQESIKAEAEKGDEEEDHDNRKLRKPERMRMVIKNKDEGTELFKGGNYRPAAARYHKSLTHCAKFFDLSPEDVIEVNAIKCNLYLNLSSCYLKLENWEQTIRNCNDALEIEPNNVKAFFRRASAFEGKKEFDKALVDIKKCQELSDVEDKVVSKASERIRKEIAKQNDKEKKMWGKAFS